MEVLNKMKRKGQGLIVGMSIMAIILVVVLGVIFSFVSGVTNTQDSTNESLAFTSVTTDVINESVIMTNGTAQNLTGLLANDDLTVLSGIRNITAQSVISSCNVTLSSGLIGCNFTGYPADLFFDYTYISGRTETLANDDLTAEPTFRNGTGSTALGDNICNATLSTGVVICNNIHSATGFADYNYNPEGFITSGTTRTLITLITVLLAIVILVFILAFTKGKG